MSYILVTGGAGFIGTNLVNRLAALGHSVLIFDNLSRVGVEDNLEWLLASYGTRIRFMHADIRDMERVEKAVVDASAVFHLAAQVAVTSSLLDPMTDFEINARGTLNLLEAIRKLDTPPFLLYTSTNKVLGGLESVELEERELRYEPVDPMIRDAGLSEKMGIEFCSPYGCSKGAADQYVLDYAHCFQIPAVVFRMSCIYGPHQCGNEDQGWVAHFAKQALAGNSITFYGNGKQVRDALYVEDLVDAFLLAREHIGKTKAQAFNMGGGVANTVSLIELVELLQKLGGNVPRILKENWRPFDQRYYVSDTRKFSALTGWRPKTSMEDGVAELFHWLEEQNGGVSEDWKILGESA